MPFKNRHMNTNELCEKHHFFPIGHYELNQSGEVARNAEKDIRITQRVPLVYALLVDDQTHYVGKTIQGFSRPLNYHKNDVMKNVHDGIRQALSEGKKVSVYARTDGLEITHEGMELNIMDAIENALINEINPPWNRFSSK